MPILRDFFLKKERLLRFFLVEITDFLITIKLKKHKHHFLEKNI